MPRPSNLFTELDIEDPMFLHEFVADCLVDNPPEDMEAILHEINTLSSSGSDHNSSSSTTTICSSVEDQAMKHGGNTTIALRKRPRRLPEQCHNHIIAERQRRQTLSERFIALSALIPGLKKMDKTSVLGAAIIHMQQLKERIKILEEENAKKQMESIVVLKQPHIILENSECNSSTCNHNLSSKFSDEQLPDIEARFSNDNVLIKVHCEMQKGILIKIMSELEKLQLLVTTTNAMPFNGRTLDITIMTQMEADFNMRPQDVVQNLRSIFQ